MNYSDKHVFSGKKVALLSLGCKVNSYETDSIRRQFEEAGAVIVDFDEACKGTDGGADIFVINTCSVTNIADRKSRQMLRRARQNNPHAIVAATGCYAQIGAQELIDSGCADIVTGNSHKSELIDMVAERIMNMGQDMGQQDMRAEDMGTVLLSDGPSDRRTVPMSSSSAVNVSSMKDEHCYEDMRIDSCDERVRAFVKVEDGCDQFCTYCIIPYARGRVRSRSKEDVLEEIRGLAANGFKEVVITGIHVSSYGCASYEKAGEFRHEPLLGLIRETAKIDGIERIRLGSLEPRIITREFAEALAAEPKFCPYFHLSLQSGCDSVLRRMNRHYDTAEFMSGVELLREVFDRPSLNTDVIVGFPQESEEEFEISKAFLEKVNFAKMHIFKYSRRRGTAADKMDGQLTEAVKHERSEKLGIIDKKNHHDFMELFADTDETILVESVQIIDGKDYYTGLTARYVSAAVACDEFDEDMTNRFVDIRTKGFLNGEYLLGLKKGVL